MVAMTPDALARIFHDAYERLAPEYGYKTREVSAKPWSEVPEGNRNLMIATAAEVLAVLHRPVLTSKALDARPKPFERKATRFRVSLYGLLRNLRRGLDEVNDLVKHGRILDLKEEFEHGLPVAGELAMLDGLVEHLGELKAEADKGPAEGQYSALDFCDLYNIEATANPTPSHQE